MIYFDNAATSWPKPAGVMEAMRHYIEKVGANPGRSGHKMSLEANNLVTGVREKLASLFNIGDPERIVFTLNATDSLNLAIKGLLKEGDHVITSSMEHNSVTRPLYVLSRKGIKVSKINCDRAGCINVKDIENTINPATKAIIITHASNVTGTMMPVGEIGGLAKKKGLRLVVDTAQTAGLFNIDVKDMNIDLLAFPGHKSLMGPPGTGGLFIKEGIDLTPLKEGGTGSQSDVPGQPEVMPERYESGTLNTVGIAGLGAGLDFIMTEGMDKIRRHELGLTERFMAGAGGIEGINLYGVKGIEGRAPVVSFVVGSRPSGEIGAILDQRFDIACRAGLHCAPDAHRTLGTFEQKLVRFSFSYFNKPEDVDYAIQSLREIMETNMPAPEGSGGCGC
jgi:cysteine desulfurase family protein